VRKSSHILVFTGNAPAGAQAPGGGGVSGDASSAPPSSAEIPRDSAEVARDSAEIPRDSAEVARDSAEIARDVDLVWRDISQRVRQARSGAAAKTAAADPEAGAKRRRACVEAPHAEEGQGPSHQAGQRGVNSGQRAGAEVPASPLDWVMKYARITLVQLKVDRGDLGEI